MGVFDGLVCGGWSSLFHLRFLFIGVLFGVGGVFCMWYCVTCKFSNVVLIVSI